MDVTGKQKDNAPAAVQQREPARHQFLRNREKNRSPRVIIYDCEKKSVQVKRQQEVDADPKKPDYKSIELPRRKTQVTIFVDPETESVPTTEHASGGHSNVMLVKLYLDRLGKWNQVLRCLGQLRTLYVSNIEPWSETASS